MGKVGVLGRYERILLVMGKINIRKILIPMAHTHGNQRKLSDFGGHLPPLGKSKVQFIFLDHRSDVNSLGVLI